MSRRLPTGAEPIHPHTLHYSMSNRILPPLLSIFSLLPERLISGLFFLTSKIAVLKIACLHSDRTAGTRVRIRESHYLTVTYHTIEGARLHRCQCRIKQKYNFHVGFEWVFVNASVIHGVIVKEEDLFMSGQGARDLWCLCKHK